jgi:hypothetical protein
MTQKRCCNERNAYQIKIIFLRYCSKKELKEHKQSIREEREYNKRKYGKYWRMI